MNNHDALRELSALCAQLRDAEEDLKRLDEAWKAAKERVRRLVEEDIPGLMSELGVKRLVLETGETISVGFEVFAQIPKDGKQLAFNWLEEHGHGGLIKTEISVTFGRDELGIAKRIATEIVEREGRPVELDQSVHAGTLKAWLKEQLQEGQSVPLELFGARPVNIAKIKLA